MSARMRDVIMSRLGELRHEPTAKRVRASLGDTTVVDSTRAMLVWEPRRIVPSYAVPAEDVLGEVVPAAAAPAAGDVGLRLPELSDRPVLDPSIGFAVHTSPGEPIGVRAAGRTGAGFRLADEDLAGYVLLDFGGFDAWLEEDEPIVSHPRDPFHRVDVRRSSRQVRIELDGEVIAESGRPVLLFETNLPPRYYLPVEDVQAQLRPSSKRTTCAYKGAASYWTPVLGGSEVPDLGWSYPEPLPDAAAITGLVAFFTERADLVLDGVPQARPRTPWSPEAASRG